MSRDRSGSFTRLELPSERNSLSRSNSRNSRTGSAHSLGGSRSNSRVRSRRNSMVYARDNSRSNSRFGSERNSLSQSRSGSHSRYRSSHIETNFNIRVPPDGIFSSEFNHIKGEASVEMLNDVSRVLSIDHGLRGVCYTECIAGGRRLNDAFKLFDYVTNSYNERDMDRFTSSLKAGRVFNIPIDHKFPVGNSDNPLPSTCHKLGGDFPKGDAEGTATIRYDLYIRVTYYSSYYDKERCFEYTSQLLYQGDCYRYGDPYLSYSEERLFLGKLKLLIPDEYTGGMVLNPIDQEHRHSRFMRQVFNENYRKENIRDLCKDIKLRLTLSTAECFDIRSMIPLEDIYVKVSWPDTHYLEPEFYYNGKSTMLGFFEIESVKIGLQQNVFIFCEDSKFKEVHWSTIPVRNTFYEKDFPRNKPNFDIADFTYDNEAEEYFFTTTLHALTGDNGAINLMNGLKKPIVGNTVLNDRTNNVKRQTSGKFTKYFSNETFLFIDIIIGNGQAKDYQAREFPLFADINVITPFRSKSSSMFPDDVIIPAVENELQISY